MKTNTPGSLFIISGPSGAGKTSLLAEIMQQDEATDKQLTLSISYTTRPCRKGEKNGVDYFFVSPEKFHDMQKKNQLLESALVYDYHYGTNRQWVEQQLQEYQKDIVLEIDVQGAMQVLDSGMKCCTIFIFPPSFDILKERLKGRQTESLKSIKKRLKTAHQEMEMGKNFHYNVINDNYQKAVQEIQNILQEYRQKQRV